MGRPFIVHINLSDILKDQKETHYTMYIDDSKMTIVYELIEWIQWIFSLRQCLYLTHDNSVIHELEDIKILSVLNNVRAHNCDHFPCVHIKFNHLFKKLNFFVQWDGIKVPKLFLNRINEIAQKLVQKDDDVKVMENSCSEDEMTKSSEVEKLESNKIQKLYSGTINTCENQLSESLNSNVFASNKTDFNLNSNIKLDDSAVGTDNSNEVHSVASAKSEFVNVCNNNTTTFNTNSNVQLNDITVGMSKSNKIHSVLCDNNEYVHMNNNNETNSMGKDFKFYDATVGVSNSNKVYSVPSDENECVNTPIKISTSEIEKIKSLVDINLSGNTECNDDEQINESNQEKFQSISDDQKFNKNKIIKKGPKPFSVGEILTNLRSELNTSSTNPELNTSEQNQNFSLSNGVICEKMGYFDKNLLNGSDVTVAVIKRKRQRQRHRRHRPKRLISRSSKFDNFLPLPKPEVPYTPGTVKLYTPYNTKPSSHIRFPSDDEDFLEANHPESDKQPEEIQHDLSKNNELVENGMEQSSLSDGNEETLPMTQPNACDKNDESKANDISEANKDLSTLEKLIYLHDQKSNSDDLFNYSNEENEQTSGVPKTPDNYDFNLSTLRALREKFPSPMVVERFY